MPRKISLGLGKKTPDPEPQGTPSEAPIAIIANDELAALMAKRQNLIDRGKSQDQIDFVTDQIRALTGGSGVD